MIEENAKGMVDEVYREFDWSARQIVEYFGQDVLKMSPKLKEAMEKKPDSMFKIIRSEEHTSELQSQR